jgi:ApbE superfamily uncharacterized protein (UPF0280 family)
MVKKTRRGQKQCPNCKAWVKGTRAKVCPKCGYSFTNGQPAAATLEAAPAAAAAEAPAKLANAITLDQIKMVGQMVKKIGGFRRLHEMLGVIKEVGGLKKFKDLLEAMEVTEPSEANS